VRVCLAHTAPHVQLFSHLVTSNVALYEPPQTLTSSVKLVRLFLHSTAVDSCLLMHCVNCAHVHMVVTMACKTVRNLRRTPHTTALRANAEHEHNDELCVSVFQITL
jgi:hypothetical protein